MPSEIHIVLKIASAGVVRRNSLQAEAQREGRGLWRRAEGLEWSNRELLKAPEQSSAARWV